MRTGKRIEITARDIAIFRALARYRYVRSTYLHAFAGGLSETRFKERLGDLFHEGFIDRPERQWEFAGARYMPAVCEIGERAERVLAELDGHKIDASTFLAASAHRQFAHSLLICECLASIELAVATKPDLRFIPWPEIMGRAPQSTRTSATSFRIPVTSGAVIPDGFFGLEYRSEGKSAYRFFALEVDRGTMPVMRSREGQTSYFGKIAAYREIIARKLHKSHLGVPNLFVLTVTTDPQRLSDILAKLGPHESNPLFLFKIVDARALTMPAPGLLTEPWERAGLPPLRIDE
ncbi:MAG TPA: replication-relaxation family protein [Rhizomicrobium sp.]|nr:replication-relaxation family protein [Rhizomicrobium sp.]